MLVQFAASTSNSPHVSLYRLGCSQGVKNDSGGNRTIYCGAGDILLQELNNSIMHPLSNTGIIFDSFMVFPLKNFVLLTQLLFTLLLCSHQCTLLSVLHLQYGD